MIYTASKMLEYNIENQEQLTKDEFLSKAEIENLKTYSEDHIIAFSKEYKNLMSKAEVQELSEEENVQMEIFKSELETLKKAVVVNENCQKENIYYRNKEDITKSEAIENDFKALKEEERLNTIRKGFELGMIDENTLEKATGHKYFKREPKAGGGYKYYYTEAQYKKEKGGEEKKVTEDTINNFAKLLEARNKVSFDEALKNIKNPEVRADVKKRAEAKAYNQSSKPQTSDNKEGGKSKEASMVLKEMDSQEEPNYTAALNKVVKQTGVDKAKLEKELEKYI